MSLCDSLADHVTTAEFDSTGDYLAVGDKAGRIWIYESADIDDEVSKIIFCLLIRDLACNREVASWRYSRAQFAAHQKPRLLI